MKGNNYATAAIIPAAEGKESGGFEPPTQENASTFSATIPEHHRSYHLCFNLQSNSY